MSGFSNIQGDEVAPARYPKSMVQPTAVGENIIAVLTLPIM